MGTWDVGAAIRKWKDDMDLVKKREGEAQLQIKARQAAFSAANAAKKIVTAQGVLSSIGITRR